MIVLNGEPFTRYNLRSIYPFAHQIIVVEGACGSAGCISTKDGHSKDGTLEVLRRFQLEEDPEKKVQVVTAEEEGRGNGFWSEKDEMSRAYAKRATGNYIWQVDSDEFYVPRHMGAVIRMLREDPQIKVVSFPNRTFWGGLDCRVDGFYLRGEAFEINRLFSWENGYRYATHRPPTVVDEKGRNIKHVKRVSAKRMEKMGIHLHHYELLFPKQVIEKCEYYKSATWLKGFSWLGNWLEESYLSLRRPYRVHMVYHYLSWLEKYSEEHPPQVVAMMDAVRRGDHPGVVMRSMQDAHALLSDPKYAAMRKLLKVFVPIATIWSACKKTARTLLKRNNFA